MEEIQLSKVRIHALSEDKFNKNKNDGTLEENQFYLTPAPEIVDTPIQDSNALITSGGVYEAFQNIPNNNPETESYTAGNLIDISNGVISSTLGTPITIEKSFEIANGLLGDGDTSMLPPWTLWQMPINDTVYEGQTLKVYIEDTNNEEIYAGEGTLYLDQNLDTMLNFADGTFGLYCTINSTETSVLNALMTGSLPLLNENIPFTCSLVFDIDTNNLIVGSMNDYNGIKIKIQENKIVDDFIKLPDEALTEGNLIEIKDGKISSTLGKRSTTITKQNAFECNIIPAGDYDSDAGIYIYEYTPTYSNIVIGDVVTVNFINSNNEISTISNVNVFDYDGNGYIFFINSLDTNIETVLSQGFTKINNSQIAFLLLCVFDDGRYFSNIVSSEDCQGCSIHVFKDMQIDNYVTLPNEALTFDKEPTPNSTNLVNSGDLFKAFQNISDNFVFDDKPTQGSENLLTSGTIYNIIGDVNTVMNNIRYLIGGTAS